MLSCAATSRVNTLAFAAIIALASGCAAVPVETSSAPASAPPPVVHAGGATPLADASEMSPEKPAYGAVLVKAPPGHEAVVAALKLALEKRRVRLLVSPTDASCAECEDAVLDITQIDYLQVRATLLDLSSGDETASINVGQGNVELGPQDPSHASPVLERVVDIVTYPRKSRKSVSRTSEPSSPLSGPAKSLALDRSGS